VLGVVDFIVVNEVVRKARNSTVNQHRGALATSSLISISHSIQHPASENLFCETWLTDLASRETAAPSRLDHPINKRRNSRHHDTLYPELQAVRAQHQLENKR
jgi:hypothetical protein